MYDYITSTGLDFHRFKNGTHCVLGGVKIPSSFSLVGHSDADVLLHALTDAILSAIGCGDIGLHFPDQNPQFQGKESSYFLKHALHLATEKSYHLIHCSLTLIGETPKISPWRQAIVCSIAQLTNLPEHRIGIAATTTEHMGFLGRQESLRGHWRVENLGGERSNV